jgi:hypothetical protein
MFNIDVRRQDDQPDLRHLFADNHRGIESVVSAGGRHPDVDDRQLRFFGTTNSRRVVASPAWPTTW